MRTILFTGGGTLGPVTPLLAVAARIHEMRPELKLVWVGTDNGPEQELVHAAGIPFATLPVAKLPRYLSRQLFTFPFDYLRARRQASKLLDEARPSLIISAGGHTAVPIIAEASQRRIPCIAHQLDYTPGMSNRVVAKQCRYVTTSFDYSRYPFGTQVVTYRIPTPTRFSVSDLPTREFACKYFGFDPEKPVLLVTGGGTGAKSLNEAFYAFRNRLPPDTQILHLTGKGKSEGIISEMPTYIVNEFLKSDMLTAFAAADLVVSRAGVGAISELAALSKPTILVPLPDSPQIANARELRRVTRVIDTSRVTWPIELESRVRVLLADRAGRSRLGQALHATFSTDKGEALAGLALSVLT